MSDDFLKLAAQEINQDISAISTIMNSCKTDNDVIQKASNIEKHVHKIKGLGPMMGKEDLGNLASQIDFILKKIIDGQNIKFFNQLSECVSLMKTCMDPGCDPDEIKKHVETVIGNLK
jgi:HPt (histidine-containing phosphotransfer) domain-containing protein